MYQPRDEFQVLQKPGGGIGSALTAEHVLVILRRQWPLILAVMGGIMVLVVLYLLTATPMYTASARILVDTRQAQVADRDTGAPSTLIDTGFVDSQVEILNSDDLILSVVRKLDLAHDSEFTGSGGIIAALMRPFALLFGDDGPPSNEKLEHGAVEAVQKNLKVERILTTYVLAVSFRSIAPDKAARITNAIADAYMVGALEAKYQATKRASEWLQQRSAELRDQATEADRAVQTFKAQNNIVGTSRGLMNEQQLSDVNTQLVQARATTAEAKARLDRVTAITDKDLSQPTVTDALNNPVITRLRAQYLDIAAQYAEWSSKYGKTHQATVNLANRMEELRKSIADEVRRIADSYRSEYEIARSREASLENDVNTMVAQAAGTGQAQVKLRNLESAADTYRNLYNNFLDKLQQATQKESFPVSEARLISTAVKPDRKSSPKTLLVLIGGLIGGFFFGLGTAFSLEFLSDVFRTASDVEDDLGIKCLGILPDMAPPKLGLRWPVALGATAATPRRRPRVSRYVVDFPFSRFAETLRNIKVSIDVTRMTREVKVIGIISSLPKEGKTTVAANFAHLTALTGHRTLLIDGDLHSRSLTRELAPAARSGLIEVLRDPRTLHQHIQRSPGSGLDFLPAVLASRMVNSADVMASNAMANLLGSLRDGYDYIVIDLAPIMPVTDAKAIGPLLDGLIYVIEWGATKRSALHESIGSVEGLQKKIIGAVLNRANPKMLRRIEAYKGAHYNSYYVENA
ncbi:MAG: GNVR domain-containing protein [Xanthobacteraceae bacterium]|nr:GNVR domain-containing protein [Xanthobacteraceae bacterium]